MDIAAFKVTVCCRPESYRFRASLGVFRPLQYGFFSAASETRVFCVRRRDCVFGCFQTISQLCRPSRRVLAIA